MAGQGRSVESWNALAPSTRRRWIAAFGGPDAALEAYRNGASLTPAQRGHAYTPERPIDALLNPARFGAYVAQHTPQLNELARQRGLANQDLGQGPRGYDVTSYKKAGGDFTYVVPSSTIDQGDWRFSKVFREREAAQLEARRSWAPAGVVIIGDRGPQYLWRWELWFLRDSDPSHRRGRRRPQDKESLRRLNAKRRKARLRGKMKRSKRA